MKKIITSILFLLTVFFSANAVDLRYLPQGIFKVDMFYQFVKGAKLDDLLNDHKYINDNLKIIMNDDENTIRVKPDGFVIIMLAEHLDTMQLISVKKETGGYPGYIYTSKDNKHLKVIQVKNVYHFYWENNDGVIMFTITT